MTVALRSKAAAFALALAAVTLVACGGGSKDSGSGGGGDDSAAKKKEATALIKKIVGPNPKARSARIDGTIDLEIRGVPRYKGDTQVTASGVYGLKSGATVPDFDVDVGLVLNEAAISGGLVMKDSVPYVRLGSSGYKIPDDIAAKIIAPAAAGHNGLTKTAAMFYINPQNWQKNAIVVGDEDVAGVSTTHIKADIQPKLFFADITRLVRLLTLLRVTEATGLPEAITPKARRALVRSTTIAKGEVWVAKSDNVLRKAHLTGRLVVAKADRKALGGMTGADLDAVITIDEVGSAKKVSLPPRIDPYADLQLALDVVGEAIRNKLKGEK